jgi:hypothetical protein
LYLRVFRAIISRFRAFFEPGRGFPNPVVGSSLGTYSASGARWRQKSGSQKSAKAAREVSQNAALLKEIRVKN